LIGSGWDAAPAGPDAPLAHHLAEWIDGSAVAPALAAANVQSIAGPAVLEAIAGDRLAAMGGHAGQYATGAVARLLRPLEPIAAAGGWWCSGLDPLAAWRPMAWGCLKPDAPRWDAAKGKPRKYEHPIGTPARCWWLRVPAAVAQLVADRFAVALPPEVAADGDGSAGAFWRWWAQTPALPLLLTEGAKKAGALLSAGVPAVAAPGIWNASARGELAPDLAAVPLQGRACWVLFDASDRPDPAEPRAAKRLGRLLERAGAVVLVGTVPGPHKGADDALADGVSWDALAAALRPLGPEPVLPRLGRVDRIAAAGAWLGVACPVPAPEVAPLVALQAPMGCGKSQAIAAALAPLQASGTPLLLPSHRVALGRALAERLGVAWAPAPGDDQRLLGAGLCLDSCCPASGLQINGHSWSGAAVVLDEWQQALEHLLLSSGTALAKRRGAVLRTLAELIARSAQTIAADAQLSAWAVALLERLTGRGAVVIASEHQPMAGRPLHCPEGLKTPAAAADAFRAQWAQLVADGRPFLCWTSAQRAGSKNAPQTLAALHRQRRPADLVDVIDSSTPELAAELAADPDGFAERRTAQAAAQGGSWALYCSPSISSGISWARWRPAAVLALAGGRIAPEHAAQAAARVRCPEVPAYVFAPERCPGAALRVGSGATDPAELIAALQAVTDPLLGQLEAGGADGAWLAAWAELGATRNRQRFAYRATIAGLLQAEGWELQAPGPEPCPAAGAQAAADLRTIAEAAQAAEDQAVIEAEALTDQEAAELARRRRRLEPTERAALDRHRLAAAWGLKGTAPSQALIDADRDGLRDRLRLGWLLTCPEALALIPAHDRAAVAALDRTGRPFAPDRLRVALAPRVAALQALGLPALLERFAAGETIAATDPAVIALHAAATAHRAQLAAAAGVSPGVKATGTLRAVLAAVGWRLERAGRCHGNGALTYRAQGVALPDGVEAQALAAAWLAELQAPSATDPSGALFAPIGNPCRGEKCSTGNPGAPPPPRPWPLAPVAAVPWPAPPPHRPRQEASHAA
jgi:hypothetical protein